MRLQASIQISRPCPTSSRTPRPLAIQEPLTASLHAVAAAMAVARDPWWVITSAAVALHGADPGPVADVDVLLSVEDAQRILPSIGVEVRQGSAHPDFRSSVFGTWIDPPLPVEFMAGFHHRSASDWHRVAPSTRQPIDIEGSTVFVPEKAELKRMLEAFGRPKDIERARLLRASG